MLLNHYYWYAVGLLLTLVLIIIDINHLCYDHNCDPPTVAHSGINIALEIGMGIQIAINPNRQW
jgi:hypothetical protein